MTMLKRFISFCSAGLLAVRVLVVLGMFESLWVLRPFLGGGFFYYGFRIIFSPVGLLVNRLGGDILGGVWYYGRACVYRWRYRVRWSERAGATAHDRKKFVGDDVGNRQNKKFGKGLGFSFAGLVRGRGLNRAFKALGPIAIKFGQGLSVRGDVVGHDVAFSLAGLQDELPPFSFGYVRRTIEKEFGMPLAAMFESFDPRPVAAASVAGVYRARLNGQAVAVKILRPHIRERFLRDVRRLKNLAYWAAYFSPLARALNVVAIVATFEDITERELNLTLEASSAQELADHFRDKKKIFYVPTVYWQGVSEKVLTLEWIDGFRLDDDAQFKKHKLDKEALLRHSAEVFFLQVFRDGFFHADLHPGNVLFRADGSFAPVDFGIMGRLDYPHQIFLAELLSGFLSKNYERVARAHEKIGLLPRDKLTTQERNDFIHSLRAIGEIWLLKNTNDISLSNFLPQLFQTLRRFGMTPRTHLLLLQKTIIMAEGLGRMLSDKTTIWQLAEPFMENWLKEHYAPHRQILYLLRHWYDEGTYGPEGAWTKEKIIADLLAQGFDQLDSWRKEGRVCADDLLTLLRDAWPDVGDAIHHLLTKIRR